MLRFQYKELLYALAALVLVLLVLLYAWQKRKSIIRKIGNPAMVKAQLRSFSAPNFWFKAILGLFALAALIIGAANLQRPSKSDPLHRKGVDVVIALDVSRSMLAEDVKPSRLEKARQLVYKLMDEMGNDRIGLVVFAGHAYLQMPLTSDHSAARLYVQNASPDVVPTQGTVVGEALKMCSNAFINQERKYKSVILITDGEDHDAEAVQLIPSLAENGIMVNTVGLGSTEGSLIPDPATGTYKTDLQGQPVKSKLNETLLQQIATGTKGTYVHLEQIPEAVSTISKQLSTIEQTALDDNSLKDFDSYFQWFLAAALLFLVAEFFWPERKWKLA